MHVNRRCDDLIEILFTIEEDVFYDRMRKEVIMNPQDASLKSEGTERHERGRSIANSNVIVRNKCFMYKSMRIISAQHIQ